MILSTPTLNNLSVFDAHYPYRFSFLYSGNQCIKNRIIIRNSQTYEIIYDKTQETTRLSHVVEADTLKNGITYNVQVQVFDKNDNSSNPSESAIFTCHATPQFHLTNVTENMVIDSANCPLSVTFHQEEGDQLTECKYYLYDRNRNQLSASESFYDASNYTFYGLQNDTTYYVRALGVSTYGFSVDTDFIKINVQHNRVPTNLAVKTYNSDGKLIIDVNIVTNDYDLENENYSLENGELTLEDNVLTYHLANINDYTLVLKARNVGADEFFRIIGTDGSTLALSICKVSGSYYAKLKAVNKYNDTYVQYINMSSEMLSDTSGDVLINTKDNALTTSSNEFDENLLHTFEVTRKNKLYSFEVYHD